MPKASREVIRPQHKVILSNLKEVAGNLNKKLNDGDLREKPVLEGQFEILCKVLKETHVPKKQRTSFIKNFRSLNNGDAGRRSIINETINVIKNQK